MKSIHRVYKDHWGHEFTIPQHSNENHPAYNSLGGSELYTINLFKNVPKRIRDRYNIIVSRWVEEVIDSNKPTIYILQDLPNDPMYEHLRSNDWSSDRIEKVIFVSHWQREMFQLNDYNIPLEKSLTIHNAVEPANCNEDKWKEPAKGEEKIFRIVYTSTPQRGLEILLQACHMLRNRRSDFILEVFSGFDIYGFYNKNKPFEPLFKQMNKTDWVVNHGVQSNEMVRDVLKDSHIFCLPSIWPETSCMAVMEGMYAGNMVVASAFGALPETISNCGICYDMPGSPEIHVRRLSAILNHCFDTYHTPGSIDRMKFGRAYADRFYSWRNRGPQWQNFLTSHINQIDSANTE